MNIEELNCLIGLNEMENEFDNTLKVNVYPLINLKDYDLKNRYEEHYFESGKKYQADTIADGIFEVFIKHLLTDLKKLETQSDPLLVVINDYSYRKEKGELCHFINFWALTENGAEILYDNCIILETSNQPPLEGSVRTNDYQQDLILNWVKKQVTILRQEEYKEWVMGIDELNLSVRSYNLLHRKGINDVDVLLSMTDDEIIGLYNGQKAMGEIIEVIKPLRKIREKN